MSSAAHNTILALDIASLMGVTWGEPGGIPRMTSIRLARADDDGPDAAFGRIVSWMTASVKVPLRAVYIENPIAYGAMKGRTNSATTHLLNGLADCAVGVARARRVPCHRVEVSTVREFVIGDGRLRSALAKFEVMRICRAAGLDPQNDNESDAWAVWLWAAALVAPDRVVVPREHWREPCLV